MDTNSQKQKSTSTKLTPSQLLSKQMNGNIVDDKSHKSKIVQFLNLGDFSIYTDSRVPVDEPLFESIPTMITFSDYQPLQIKDKLFKLRNKDKFARRIKIIQPDSRLFQVLNVNKKTIEENSKGNKVAPGMEIQYIIRFSPEAKIDYSYDLVVVTEREKFVVPILAIGKRSMIDFPDLLDFENCPVKYVTEKPVIIRNLGEKTTKWFLTMPQGFDCNKTEGVLEAGNNEQIIVKFFPQEAKHYKNEVILSYEKLQAYVQIIGKAYNGNVYLSKSHIQMEDAYIGLRTQQILHIVNKSNVKVDFQWRSFKTEKEELDKKNRLYLQLDQEESEERMMLKEVVQNEVVNEMSFDDFEDSDDEERDEKTIMHKRQRKAELQLARKYKNIRKAIDDDMLLFQDDIFQIEPQIGEIWPNSKMTITITFIPQSALQYSCTCFCNIACSDERLQLHLAGEGIGPKAFLSTTEFPIGDIFVTDEFKTDVTIENRGEIEAKFELINNNSPFGKMFKFNVEEGILGVGEKIPFKITFCSTILGEFSENFRWRLGGSSEVLQILFTGHVMAPSFSFNADSIDYGKVSYSFPNRQVVKFSNTSTVPFKFQLRIPGDGKLSEKEFDIKPSRDQINPKSTIEIEIIFISLMPRKYDMVMVVDIDGVGQDMFSLPIKAESEVPLVKIDPLKQLNFGTIFLRNPDVQQIVLTNDSSLQAKFQVLPQSEESKVLAEYHVDQESGQIEQHGQSIINVSLFTKKLGEITLPLAINIVGNQNNNPHTINIMANSIGPIVEVAVKELDFGNVTVLKDYILKINIKNKSMIEADFHAFTKKKPKETVFKPIQKHGLLKPEESMDIEVVCNADEANKFQDTLHFVIREGVDVDVQLKAKGVGSTIFFKDDLNDVNFGVLYTCRSVNKDIFVENKGRKTQVLSWQKKKLPQKSKETKKDGKKEVEAPVEEDNVFQIFPERVQIPSKHGFMFQFKALSLKKGTINEQYILNVSSANDRKAVPLLTSTITGDFIVPSLNFSKQKLNFKYLWEKGVPMQPISQVLEMTCGSSLPTNFVLKTNPPFSISQESFSLQPGKNASVRIDFDPGMKTDRISGLNNGKLQVIHMDHPYRDNIELIGELCFPNLVFETQNLNFGSILCETTKKMNIKIQNVSEMSFSYQWNFLEEEMDNFSINEVFDILPLSGFLQPGESENVEFIYNSVSNHKVKAIAVCHVEGGPDYEVTLEGDSSLIAYKISSNLLELGEVRFCDWVQKEFYIENTGKVQFNFTISLNKIIRKGLVEVVPKNGKINGNEKQKITLKICPGMPDIIKEQLSVEVGYFEPEIIKIEGKGIQPSLVTSLPRVLGDNFLSNFLIEKAKIRGNEAKYLEQFLGQEEKYQQVEVPGKTTELNLSNEQFQRAEQISNRIESEIDRKQFCEMILRNINDFNMPKQDPNSTIMSSNDKSSFKIFERIVVSTLVCDFGNIVINSFKKKVIKITNTGQLPADISYDTKVYKQAGYQIVPEKIVKLPPDQSAQIVISYQAKKNSKFGQSVTVVPIEVKNGPRYNLELKANITIPEITIENLQSDTIDFNSVIIGQRKTIFIRFVNNKEITCEWSLNTRIELVGVDKGAETRYSIHPSSGIIQPGQKQMVQLSFTPNSANLMNYKFSISVKENPKNLVICVKGSGTFVSLEITKDKFEIGPVLPYDEQAYQKVEFKNTSDYDTELYSLDFDKQFIKEEEYLKKYTEFGQNNALYLSVREPGKPFWDFIVKDNERRERREQIQRQLESASEEEQKQLQKELEEISQSDIIDLPQKVEEDQLHHVIVYGPPGCGKTQAVRQLAKTHRRCVINMNELFEWNQNLKTKAFYLAEEALSKNQKILAEIMLERDTLIKKAGKKGAQVEQELGTVDETPFNYLPEEVLVALLQERISHPEAGAGCIFDNIKSSNYHNEIIGIKVILKVLKNQNVQMIIFQGLKDSDGLEVCKPIEVDNFEKMILDSFNQTKEVFNVKKGGKKQATQEKAKDKKKTQNVAPIKQEQKALFDVFYPKQFENDKQEEIYNILINDIINLFQKKVDQIHLEKLKIPQALNPFEEQRRLAAEQKLKDTKKKGVEVEPDLKGLQSQEYEQIKQEIQSDKCIMSYLPIHFNLNQLFKTVLELVPAPVYPDPNSLPVPEPIFHQVVVKPNERNNKKQAKLFTILTPQKFYKDELQEGDNLLDNLDSNKVRWIIPAKKTLVLIIKFITTQVGKFDTKLEFESFFSIKQYNIQISGISDFPQISNLPKNIFYSWKKQRPLQAPESYFNRTYVQSENLFDFGPLLIGKNSFNKTQYNNTNSATFRISNQGKFDCHVEFALMSSVVSDDPEYSKSVFMFEPNELDIKVNDIPQEIRVWAIPDKPQRFRDELIVMIHDNPLPVILPIICLGQKPEIEILEGQTLVFDRLLLKQQATKIVKLRNKCAIPVKWRLKDFEQLPQEFSLQNTFGELKPTQETIISISFKAIQQMKFQHKITVEVSDTEDMQLFQEPQIIQIEAEAFNISVDLKFPVPTQENMIDYGAMKVGEVKDQIIQLKNIGLYRIKFNFSMKKKQFRDCFSVEPSEGELEPNQEKPVTVRFSSQKELKLKTNNNNTDITLEILEGKTLELFKPVPINVSVNSVFSKYSISPLNSINFGPLQFNEQKTRILEIKNDGLFEYNFTVFDYNNQEARNEIKIANEAYKESLKGMNMGDGKGKKDAKKDNKPAQVKKETKKGEKDVSGLTIGSVWRINPNFGSIPPESSINVEVIFIGNSQKLYEQKIGIDIQGRDPDDQPNGCLYQFIGESCIPGIITENFESIFEEQIVVASSGQQMTSMINSNVFAVEEKTFLFGTLFPSKSPDGIIEKFKITNFNKIPCTVKFEVKKRSEKQTEQFGFEVFPKNVKILPHEYTYVKVSFKPTIMAQYAGVFEAIVENGEQNPKTHKLIFDLRGEGALPTLKIEKPKEFFDERTYVLKFPKTRVDKSFTLPILLKNDGMVPATCRFDLTPNENFRFLKESSYTLAPKTYHSFDVEFMPKAPGPKQWTIGVQTLMNPYEVSRILISGDAFHEDITFENLPNELEDQFELGDCIINQEKRIFFNIKNNSVNQIKFNFNTQGMTDVQFIPSRGHLNIGQTKSISLSFMSPKTVNYNNVPIICETQHMSQTHQFADWDDSKSVIRYITKSEYDYWQKRKEEEIQRKKAEEEAIKNKKKDTKQVKAAVVEQVPDFSKLNEEANIPYEEVVQEPDFKLIEKTERQISLKFSAVADYARYEVDQTTINFLPTMMFTQRTHQFKIRNISLINLKYRCKLVDGETGIPDTGYYSVNPKEGVISPSCDEWLTVKFQPTECDENNIRLLMLQIENLNPEQEKLIIELDAESDRPICHFELQNNSQMKEKKPELDHKYKFLEFESIGTKILNTKRFYVANPTSQGYSFEWHQIEDTQLIGQNQHNYIKCKTPKGVILSGKKFEMIFEYLPESIGTHESFWNFEIPQQKQVQNFYISGNVREPNVFIDTGKVNFGPLLLSGKNKEQVKLKNLEQVPIQFFFDKESIKGDSELESITVFPMSGVVKANSDMTIEITFAPKEEKSFNFNILCFLKRKSRPISLNIKGIGYQMHQSVSLENKILQYDDLANINMGDIYINEKRTKNIQITNSGDFNFDFAIKKNNFLNFIQIIPESGTVKKQDKMNIEVQFSPLEECRLVQKSTKFSLQITSGPTYQFQISGSSRKPLVDLSFYSYDFGPCFVLKQPLPQIAHLEMINRDNSAMTIETQFQKNLFLDFKLDSGQVLLPFNPLEKGKNKNSIQVPIVFTPRDYVKYQETISLNINSLHKIDIQIKGEGVPLKLELEKSEDQIVDFGIQRVGSDVTKIISLINQSKKQIKISFDCGDQVVNLQKFSLGINPLTEIIIPPRERKEIEIRFSPKMRLHDFKQDLFYKIQENQEIRKLLIIQGCSHGVELKLLENTIGFGAVVINSKLTRTIQLSNLGDIGCHFSWDTRFCSKFFTINPDQGFLPPHDDLQIEVTFHPDVVDNDIRFMKVKCKIEESDPIFINLLGKCIQQPKENVQEIKFDTVVRTATKQKIVIKNTSQSNWRIKVQCSAVLDSQKGYFEGKELLEISANSQSEYEVTYLPLSMTANSEHKGVDFHRGTLFLPLPDGSALLYNLIGKSNSPQAAQVLDVAMKAKQTFTQPITVKNWLPENQRFTVKWTVENEDPGLFINGANTIDLTPNSTKEYKINFYSLKPILQKLNVYFRNQETNEYIFYKINLNIQAPDVQGKLEMASVVRETCMKLITIENLLSKQVHISKENFFCDNENITFHPQNFVIPEKAEFGLEVLYRPLIVSELQSKFTIKNNDLGEYQYALQLSGLPQTSQRQMTFKTTLGTEIVQTFKFINFLKKATSYFCKIEKQGAVKNLDPKAKVALTDFSLDTNEIKAPPADSFEGNELGLSIRFEPSSLVESRSILQVYSNDGGEYQCLLIGYCTAPQPKGPFKITGAKPPTIDFKNPFLDAMEFTIRIDNPCFVSTTKSPIKIDAKKLISIQLTYKATPNFASNGRLTIQTGDLPPWVFYLQGE